MQQNRTSVIRVRGLAVSLERLSYATIVLMSVLVVYDGWDQLASFAGAAVVVLGPTVALAAAHLFSEALDEHADHGRPLTAAEWRRLSANQLQVLLAAVPPLFMLAVGWLSPLDPRSTITVILWTGVFTLAGLAAIAGRRAGFRGWRWLAAAISGGAVGLFVVSLQVLLKPH